MELKLTTHQLDTPNKILGVSNEREIELITFCDNMVISSLKPALPVSFLVLIQRLAEQCNNLEEYTYIIIYFIKKAINTGFLIVIDHRTAQN